MTTLWPEYEYVFLFDHSCGHDRQRPDGLTTIGLNKGFGGAQARMRDSKIEEVGPNRTPLTLKVGDVQQMQFKIDDVGPCWMSAAQRESSRNDRPSGKTKMTKRNAADLKRDLQGKGVLGLGDKKELQRLSTLNNIPIEMSVETIIEGWAGKSKGMLQILFERGYIDPTKMDEYSVKGKKRLAWELDCRNQPEASDGTTFGLPTRGNADAIPWGEAGGEG